MPYPTSSFSIRLEDLDRRLVAIKARAEREVARMAAEATPSSRLFALHAAMKAEAAELTAARTFASSTPGFVAYVRDVKGDGTLDVGAEFLAVLSAVEAVVAAIEAGFPADASGFLLAQTWGANGPADRTFTPAQTSGIRSQLSGVVAAIA